MISVTDPDARHTRKSQQARRDGYRAHVAADPETGIITDEQLTRASGQENGRSTLKWPHCSPLIWPLGGRRGGGSSPLIWPHLRWCD